MWWMRRDGKYGWSGSDMIANVIIGLCMFGLICGLVYGIYMAIWGVYDEYN